MPGHVTNRLMSQIRIPSDKFRIPSTLAVALRSLWSCQVASFSCNHIDTSVVAPRAETQQACQTKSAL